MLNKKILTALVVCIIAFGLYFYYVNTVHPYGIEFVGKSKSEVIEILEKNIREPKYEIMITVKNRTFMCRNKAVVLDNAAIMQSDTWIVNYATRWDGFLIYEQVISFKNGIASSQHTNVRSDGI